LLRTISTDPLSGSVGSRELLTATGTTVGSRALLTATGTGCGELLTLEAGVMTRNLGVGGTSAKLLTSTHALKSSSKYLRSKLV
jgi:hypothetical protein